MKDATLRTVIGSGAAFVITLIVIAVILATH